MGIYIPNMEKPQECQVCPIFIWCYTNDWKGYEHCPTIEIVHCKDCKHYDTESRTFPCCTDIYGAVRYMEADGFCSKGERKEE